MKALLWIRMTVTVVASITLMATAQAGGEMKKVCHTDKVKGKEVEVCKTIKVHKKLEGKQVPTK